MLAAVITPALIAVTLALTLFVTLLTAPATLATPLPNVPAVV